MLKSSTGEYNNVRGDMMLTTFLVTIHPCTDVSGYWAECTMPNGGCTAQGDTLQETQKNILEATAIYLEDYPDISDYCLMFEVQNG